MCHTDNCWVQNTRGRSNYVTTGSNTALRHYQLQLPTNHSIIHSLSQHNHHTYMVTPPTKPTKGDTTHTQAEGYMCPQPYTINYHPTMSGADTAVTREAEEGGVELSQSSAPPQDLPTPHLSCLHYTVRFQDFWDILELI